MPYVTLDNETYSRIEQIAAKAGISVHNAADSAISNWIDVTSGSLLAITARIAKDKDKAKERAA